MYIKEAFQRHLSTVLIAVGAILRLSHLLYNRSLWMDEAALVLSMKTRSFRDILLSLNYDMDLAVSAPIGFLLWQKGMMNFFGNHEMVLRFLPFILSLFSVVLFYRLAQAFIDEKEALLALSLFALSGPLIYYSAEFKAYMCDVFAAIVVIMFAVEFLKVRITLLSAMVYCLLSALLVYFSYSSVFVLSASALVVGYYLLFIRRNFKDIIIFVFANMLWLTAFLSLMVSEFSQLTGNRALLKMWGNAFMPRSGFSIETLSWINQVMLSMCNSAVGLSLGIISVLLLIIGAISLVKKDRWMFGILAMPFILVFMASAMHKYPIGDRFILFLSPFVFIFIAKGIFSVGHLFKRWQAPALVGIIIVTLAYPVKAAVRNGAVGYSKAEMRPIVQYLKTHYRSSDALYVNQGAMLAFGYYLGYYRLRLGTSFVGFVYNQYKSDPLKSLDVYFRRGAFDKEGHYLGYLKYDTVKNKEEWERFKPHLTHNKRTWFVFSHIDGDQQEKIVQYLTQRSRKVKEYQTHNAAIYLFDFSHSI